MAKTTNPSASRIKKQKVKTAVSRDPEVPTSPWIEQYRDCFGWKMVPVTERCLQQICADLVYWSQNDQRALKVSQFLGDKGIPIATWFTWCSKYDWVQEKYEQALMFLGNRREMGALTRELDSKMVMFTLHQYDPEWKRADKYHADLKIEDERKGAMFIIAGDKLAKPKVETPEELKVKVDETQE